MDKKKLVLIGLLAVLVAACAVVILYSLGVSPFGRNESNQNIEQFFVDDDRNESDQSTQQASVDEDTDESTQNTEQVSADEGTDYDPYEYLTCQANTYASMKNEYPEDYQEMLEKYCTGYAGIGDSAAWIEIESNYSQYEMAGDDSGIQAYQGPIEVRIAKLSDSAASKDGYKEDASLEEKVTFNAKYGSGYDGVLYANRDDNYYQITGLAIMNGNNTSSEAWNSNARAKKIKVTVNGEQSFEFDLKDQPGVQVFDLDYRQDSIDKPVEVTIEVLKVYKGNTSDDVYISDIRFGFDSSVSGGR